MVDTRLQIIKNNLKTCDEQLRSCDVRINDLIIGKDRLTEMMNVTRKVLKEDIEKVNLSMGKDMNELRSILGAIQKALGKENVIEVGNNSNHSSSQSMLGVGPSANVQRPAMMVNEAGVIHGATGGAPYGGSIIEGYKKHLKMDFPKFNGDDHRGWIHKCFEFFKFRYVPDFERVDLATMHFKGTAEFWYQIYINELERLSWGAFTHEVSRRIGLQPYENMEGEFAKLRQTSTVAEYQDKFEELMALMKAENPDLTERYLLIVLLED